MASKQDDVSDGSPYAGKVMELGEIKELLAKFGMMVGLDTSPGPTPTSRSRSWPMPSSAWSRRMPPAQRMPTGAPAPDRPS